MIFLLAWGAALAALAAVWSALIARDTTSRLRQIAREAAGLRDAAGAARRNPAREAWRDSGLGLMRAAVSRFQLMKGRELEQIAARLSRAGWRSKDAMTGYLFAKALLPLLVLGGVVGMVALNQSHRLSVMQLSLIALSAAVAGLTGVDRVVTSRGNRRVHQLRRALPDVLDLLVICVEAGLSLDAAIKRVGRELIYSAPAMADELLLTEIELNFLPDRQQALKNLASRADMAQLRAIVASLLQADRFGTPLSGALRVLSAEFREERMIAAEEKAARLPTLMTLPMIGLILPSLFCVVLGPAAIHVGELLKATH